MPPLTSPSVTDDGWTPPASFDQFVIERPLGRGGMGHVYLGRDVALDRPVALKFIASPDPSPAARSRFLVEARAIAKLSHPNVVGVYRVGEVADHPYIAYEFLAGESLDKLAKPVGWETALRLALGLARGLAAAHGAGILHRDIKPGNAVLDERGEIKLLDFGLAKLGAAGDTGSDASAARPRDDAPAPPPVGADAARDPRERRDDDVATSSTERVRIPTRLSPRAETLQDHALTRPGTLMGTPAYLAPELWWGDPASTRSDVFALGLVVYELLVGRLPHAHLETEEMAFTVIDKGIPALRTARPDVPESFAAVVDRCVRRDAAERFASAAELVTALDEIKTVFLPASGTVNGRTARAGARRRRRVSRAHVEPHDRAHVGHVRAPLRGGPFAARAVPR